MDVETILSKIKELRMKKVKPSIFCTTPEGFMDNFHLSDDTSDGCSPTCSPCNPCRPEDRPMQCTPDDNDCYPTCRPCSPCSPCLPDNRQID